MIKAVRRAKLFVFLRLHRHELVRDRGPGLAVFCKASALKESLTLTSSPTESCSRRTCRARCQGCTETSMTARGSFPASARRPAGFPGRGGRGRAGAVMAGLAVRESGRTGGTGAGRPHVRRWVLGPGNPGPGLGRWAPRPVTRTGRSGRACSVRWWSFDDPDLTAGRGCGGDALVAGEQGRSGHLGQGYVGGVVGGEVLAQFPNA